MRVVCSFLCAPRRLLFANLCDTTYDFDNFVFLAPTGNIEDGLPEANYAQGDARFYGSEIGLNFGVLQNRLNVNSSFDFVNARIKDGSPLPRIPPVRGRFGVEFLAGGLLGANGAGKTTTINLFLNFVNPTSGKALIKDLDVTAAPLETKRFLAYIPEQVMLYKNLSGLENLEYFSALAGKDRYTKEALLTFFDEVGLTRDAAEKRVSAYSKGMRQKIGIAIALAKKAEALLLDEPTSGLDPKASNEFSALLKKLSGQGVAVLMATHDLFRAKESGTRVGIMRHGRLVTEMTTDEIGHADLERVYLEQMRD